MSTHRFRDTYQGELTYLRELGREFAHANPSLARGFALEGGDPDVERLLEGFAFLAAKIRARAEDAVPELCEALTEVLLPQYLRATPATSVVQFTPKKGVLRSAFRVEEGTRLGSVEVEGTSCSFRTSSAVDLLPVELMGCRLDERVRSSPVLHLKFFAADYGRRLLREQRALRLFVHGALPLSSMLMLWLARHVERVKWASERQDGSIVTSEVPPGAISVLFERDSLASDDGPDSMSLWPWPTGASTGTRSVQEYFTTPSRGLFMQVHELARFAADSHADHFELQIGFRAPPALPEPLPEQTFRLYCTPACNLFEWTADPIRKDLTKDAQLIRGAGLPFQHVEVYSVNQVTGTRAERGGRVRYSPLYAFAPHAPPRDAAAAGDDARQGHFSLLRRQSPIDGGTDTYIRVGTAPDVQPDLREEILSLNLTCTNRFVPASLRTGDICRALPDSPRVATFTNITPVSKPVPPALGSELHWRLISHLSAHPRVLGETRRLQTMLRLYNFQQGYDVPAARMNQARIDAIRNVNVRPAQRLMAGVPMRGVMVTLDLDETGFSSAGDAYLFGCAVRRFLSEYVPINSFLGFSVHLQPSMATIDWPPDPGVQCLL